MKSLYSEAKQHLSNCMPASSTSNANTNDKHELGHEYNYDSTNGDVFSADDECVSGSDGGIGAGDHDHEAMTCRDNTLNCHRRHSQTTTPPTIGLNNNFITNATTYDTLQKPFKYDKLRGRWSTAADFYFACTSHAFGTIVFSELTLFVSSFLGGYGLIPYLLGILLYAIPIFGVQTFLGQFSSSGTITVFRVAPIFKGIGYSILLHNLASLSYYAIIAAVPLVYAANSLHSVIPWMSCNNTWNTVNCSTHDFYDEDEEELFPHATVEFFRSIIRSDDNSPNPLSISWPILCAVIGIWLLTMLVLLKRVTFIGKFLRCLCLLMMTFFFAIFTHLLMYVGFTWEHFLDYLKPYVYTNHHSAIWAGMRAAIIMPMWLLGPGCGSVLQLASHNRFRHDSEKTTYWTAFTFLIMTQMAALCSHIAFDHFEDHVAILHDQIEEQHNMRFIYICYAYLFGSFVSLPNLWSFLFFAMLFFAELSAVIIQMMTVLTAIFDEFEKLRTKKTSITIGLVLVMLLISVYFCTKQGFEHLHLLPDIVAVTHLTISILLIVITTWIYGRERFQCDLQFMLGKTISNFKINILLRFVTPFFIGCGIAQIIFFTNDPPSALILLTQSFVYIVVPLYMIYKITQTTGSFRQRIRQCFAPHDWHPVDADNRRFYEEIMGTSEMLVILNNEHQIC
ncbi:Sodium- and chloride-dependent glycine transporter 1 [Lucilia cuprina]|nr:Sodium- and chloride-dependent glycine transporter 1 [Lucilia cuprina]